MRSRQATGVDGPSVWTPKELARGTDRYRRYLQVFGLDEDSFVGQVVCHIECGPFGGVLSVLRGVEQAYRVDSCADQYRSLKKSSGPLLSLAMPRGVSPVPAKHCDAVFCLGPTGFQPRWVTLEREIRRICKDGGHLYLWWRPADGPRKGRAGGLTVTRMQRVFHPIHWEWSQEGAGMDLPNLYPAVKVRWAVLRREENR